MRDLAVQKFIKRIAPGFVPYFANGHGAVKVAFAIQRLWSSAFKMQEEPVLKAQGPSLKLFRTSGIS